MLFEPGAMTVKAQIFVAYLLKYAALTIILSTTNMKVL